MPNNASMHRAADKIYGEDATGQVGYFGVYWYLADDFHYLISVVCHTQAGCFWEVSGSEPGRDPQSSTCFRLWLERQDSMRWAETHSSCNGLRLCKLSCQ